MKQTREYRANRVFQAAMLLLCLLLISIWMLSGMLARYTVGSSGEDSARTAKFGVTFVTAGDLFPAGAKLQPGTYNDDGIELSMSGIPEVAVVAGADIVYKEEIGSGTMEGSAAGFSELCLPKGYYHVDYGEKTVEYIGETETDHEDFNDQYRFCLHLTEDYYPLQYTVWKWDETTSGWGNVEDMQDVSAAELSEWMQTTLTQIYPAGMDLSAQAHWKITWKWPKDVAAGNTGGDTGSGTDAAMTKDTADTLLLVCAAADNGMVLKNMPEGFSAKEKVELIFRISQAD